MWKKMLKWVGKEKKRDIEEEIEATWIQLQTNEEKKYESRIKEKKYLKV